MTQPGDSDTPTSYYWEFIWDHTTVVASGLTRHIFQALAQATEAYDQAPERIRALDPGRELVLKIRGTL